MQVLIPTAMLRYLLRSVFNWLKHFFNTLSVAYSYMTVRENLQGSIDRRIDSRSKYIFKNEFASSRQEANCLAYAETAGMLVNEMMTFRLKHTHSDLREFIGKYQDQDWYWHLILKQIISLTWRSITYLSESRVIASIKFRTSLPFELLKQNPYYLNKTVSDILCTHDNVELTFKCLLDASSDSEQLKKDSVEWFLNALKHSLELPQKGSFSVDSKTIKYVLASAVDINYESISKPSKSDAPPINQNIYPFSGWQTLPSSKKSPGGDINLDKR